MVSTLSCSIVTYRPDQEVLKTVSCVQSSTVPVTLYIIDNSGKNHHGMADRIKWQCPGAQIIIPDKSKNIGFGRANNLVRPSLTSRYHLFLNPDVTFEPDLLSRMMDYMDQHTNVAILTPRVFFPDGTEQFLPKKQPTVRYLMSGLMGSLPYMRDMRAEYTCAGQIMNVPTPVFFATGCFLMIRTHVYRDLLETGFDPRYFLYMEDADLSRQVIRLPKECPNIIMYHPDMCVTHAWHRADHHSLAPQMHHIVSAVKFFRKWHLKW